MQSIAKILDAKNKAPISLRHQTLPSRKQPISYKSIINCAKKIIFTQQKITLSILTGHSKIHFTSHLLLYHTTY